MSDINEQAKVLLQRQRETCSSDPLNNARYEAVSHVLTRVLGCEGFVVIVVDIRQETTHGLALAGGKLHKATVLEQLSQSVEKVGLQLGVELEVRVKTCDCEECRADRERTLH